MTSTPQRIAVIGSGVAGLATAHILQRRHRIVLLEQDRRLGGHTNTVEIPDGPDAGTPVDTGFIVMNHRNYPLLSRLFEQLDIELRDSDMSFGYHDLPSGLQYSGSGIGGLFAQRRNIASPSFLSMVHDILRFFRTARAELATHDLVGETLGDYLRRHRYRRPFIDHHLIPMGSAIWSTPCEDMMEFPAQSFLQFFENHGLLGLGDRPQWKTVVGGSWTYIGRMTGEWRQVEIRTQSRIGGIRRGGKGVEIQYADGRSERYDQVVVATHADQAIGLLSDADQEEKEALGCWRYTRNRAVLHTDESFMPPLRKVWSSWNFRRIEGRRTCLTYHMNRLQGLQTSRPYFVSLNPGHPPEGIIQSFDYEHPMYTREALEQRARLERINGKRNTWFAGSYFGNGFHEDAVRSAVEVARGFGMEL